ncbi:hypothetical protein [Streptomyces sp. NPDC086147]|uniref:hypothetical protein n=1 Tax=Streptomyces sp. NPDC086147 TaxID=3155295 RepID=UPI00344F2FD6
MESLGLLIGGLVWGAPAAALVTLVVMSVVVRQWRRKAIVALENEELEVDRQRMSGRPVATTEEV